ncbi:hypothetical protein GGI43DRAFT_434055 [Trichoderma evansii]
MATVNAFSSKEGFAAAMTDIFTCPDSELESKILSVYTKDSSITVNEKRMPWDDLIYYIRGIKNSMVDIELKAHHLLRDGNMFSEKHTAYATGTDGSKTQAEAICMGELNADNKVLWMEEVLHFSAGVDTTTINY